MKRFEIVLLVLFVGCGPVDEDKTDVKRVPQRPRVPIEAPKPDETDHKTEAEAWEAAKAFVRGSVDSASFGGKIASDVVERTGNGSFRIRSTVYVRDADGEIIPKDFDCKMASIDGEWYGVLTFTAELVDEDLDENGD